MKGFVATIGMFDGVHRGHQYVLQQVVQTAREQGLQSLVVTFDLSAFSTKPLLTTLEQKRTLITEAGIDRVEVLPFNNELKQLTARQFMEDVLLKQLHVSVLLVGYDNRFGHNRTEDFDDYVRYGQELGIEARQLRAEGRSSSSYVRQLLQEGNVSEAARELGRLYTIGGHVAHGEHIGTGLGYPTANLVPDDERLLIPAPGVYAVHVAILSPLSTFHLPPSSFPGMMNIGTRPTFGEHQQTLEVHIFGLQQDLYGKRLQVDFVERLRSEQRFDTIEALQAQLAKDAEQAKELLQNNNITA